MIAYHTAGQLSETDFNSLNDLALKLENGLLRLVDSLEKKQMTGDWVDHLMLKESNEIYDALPSSDELADSTLHHSNTPSLRY